MISNFTPELLDLLIAALTILLGLVFIFVVPAYRRSQFAQTHGHLLHTLGDVVGDTVLRLAYSGEDLSAFEEEAERTGRDVRLVAALNIVDRWTTSVGLEIDEEQIVSQIEARLHILKIKGAVPSENTPLLRDVTAFAR